MALSKARANSAKVYLVNSGVSASKISVKAYGQNRPAANDAYARRQGGEQEGGVSKIRSDIVRDSDN
jgi:outer membrane protein OmpA-like peptidoglycan-associated protein